jgi:hypothetical protein
MKLVIMNSLRPAVAPHFQFIFPQHPVFRHSVSMCFPWDERSSFIPWLNSVYVFKSLYLDTLMFSLYFCSLATGYGLDGRRVSIPGRGMKFFSSPQRTYRLRVPPCLLSNRYRGLFPRGKSNWSVKLTTTASAEVKNGGAVLPLPPYIFMAWCLIKHSDNVHLFI